MKTVHIPIETAEVLLSLVESTDLLARAETALRKETAAGVGDMCRL